nr:putative ribonuclease H-like domain-containing protein [Tanacetum cinerariifolium]
MIGNISYLTYYEEIDGGYVAFGGNPKGGKITGKDDHSRFTWVFFLSTKDETRSILKSFVTRIENLVDHKVNVIRCDSETEFKNRYMNQFCKMKGIMRHHSVARTPEQNRVVERRNRTLIEAARTMLADSKLPTTFWAEAVSTDIYVQNKVLVVKPHNMTPYELFHGITPMLSFMRPFGCPVTILNTMDHLGIQSNGNADAKDNNNAGQARKEKEPDAGFKPSNDVGKKVNEVPRQENKCNDQEEKDSVNSTNRVNVVSSTVNAASNEFNVVGRKSSIELSDDPNTPELEDISIFADSNKDVFGALADLNNLESTFQVSPIPTTRIHMDHPLEQVIGVLYSAPQTRRMEKNLEEHGLVSTVNQRTNHKDLLNCLFACFFLSQMEPKTDKQKKSVSLVMEMLLEKELELMPFWTTAKSKTVNEEVQIHALVDGMKCLSLKQTASNEFSSTIASAIICLASNRTFNFLKMLFDDKQLDGLPTHKEKYDVSFHTKKVFAYMKRIGKGFSGNETPLFPTMMGPNQLQMGEELMVKESTKKDEAETAQESSSKRKGDELKQERSKKQKMEDDKESTVLKQCLEIISNDEDEVTIDATPLSSKSLTIVDYKIYKEGKKNYF